jgi:hypothetical protein
MRCEVIAPGLSAFVDVKVKSCIACGCTDAVACPGGCEWVQDDPPLCSACAEIDEHLLEEDKPPTPGLFMRERCPMSSRPAFHTPVWLDEGTGYCARCKSGFCT